MTSFVSMRAKLASLRAVIEKANFNRFPSGAPGGKGGEFAPKQGAPGGGGAAAPGQAKKLTAAEYKALQASKPAASVVPKPTSADPFPSEKKPNSSKAANNPAFFSSPAGGYQKPQTPQYGGFWGGGSGKTQQSWTGNALAGHDSAPKAPPPGAKPHPKLNDKGEPVSVDYPTKASHKETWGDNKKTATFTPGSEVPASLNGVAIKPWKNAPTTNDGWSKVAGQNPKIDADTPFEPTVGKSVGAGVVIMESDGRMWLTRPTNSFGGYVHTFPKGTAEHGLSLQQNAIKEAYEETGLHVKITGLLGDFERDTSKARFYIAQRIGGSPADMGWESQAMRLAPAGAARGLLNRAHDRDMLDAAVSEMAQSLRKAAAPAKPAGAWTKQARWPAGTPLGGQWRAMGGDGITIPPTISNGLAGKNPSYQKTLNALHASAQAGNKGALENYVMANANTAKAWADAKAAGQKVSSHVTWKAQIHQYAGQALADVKGGVKATATATAISGPPKLSAWTYDGAKPGGSNPGAIYKDENGVRWLVKGSNITGTLGVAEGSKRAQNEVLASHLLTAAGAGAPEMKVVDLGGKHGGGLGVATKMLDKGDLTSLNPNNENHLYAARKDFAAQAWLANYDAIGMTHDNTVIRKDGTALNIDPGGALLYRAQGAEKGKDFGVSANEWNTLRDATINSQAASIYSGIALHEVVASAAKVSSVDNATITKLVNAYGPGTAEEKAALAAKLILRRDDITKRANTLSTPYDPPAVPNPPTTTGVTGTAGKPVVPVGGKIPYVPMPVLVASAKKSKGIMQAMKDAHAAAFSLSGNADIASAKIDQLLAGAPNNVNHSKVKAYAAALQATLRTATGGTPGVDPNPHGLPSHIKAPKLHGALPSVEEKYQAKIADAVKIYNGGMLGGYPGSAKKLLQSMSDATVPVGAGKNMKEMYAALIADLDKEINAQPLSSLTPPSVRVTPVGPPAASLPPHIPKPKLTAGTPGAKLYYAGQTKLATEAYLSGDAKAAAQTIQAMSDKTPTTHNGLQMKAMYAAMISDLKQDQQTAATAAIAPVTNVPPPGTHKANLPAMPKAENAKHDAAKPGLSPATVKDKIGHNNKIDQIAFHASMGDVKAVLSLPYGTNTYSKGQVAFANGSLAAMGSSHTVSLGQKANTHPALTAAGITPTTAAASAPASFKLPPVASDNSWLKVRSGEKILEQGETFGIKWAKLAVPPPGYSAAAFPVGNIPKHTASSLAHVNAANDAAAMAIHSAAVNNGTPEKLAALKFAEIDKQTGAPTGKMLSYTEHPSASVKQYFTQVHSELEAQLKPGVKKLQSGSFTGVYSDVAAKIGAGYPKLSYDQFASHHNNAADYKVLSNDAAASLPLPTSGFAELNAQNPGHASFKAASIRAYEGLSSDKRSAIKSYTGSSFANWNEALRTGKTGSSYFNAAQTMVKAFKEAAQEVPEGSILWRGIGVGESTYKGVSGGVIQDGSFQSSSYGDHPGYGSGHSTWLKIHVGKKVRGLNVNSFSANSGENEVILQNNIRYAVLKVEKHSNWKSSGGKSWGPKTIVHVLALPHEG